MAKLQYEICSQAQRLNEFMAREQIEPIVSWENALALYRKNLLGLKPIELRRQGKPFRKIALMLQEIGVIDARIDLHDLNLQDYLKTFAPELRGLVGEFIDYQRRKNRSASTLGMYLIELRHLHRWLQENRPSSHLLHILVEDIREYFSVMAERYKPGHLSDSYFRLHYFYRWAVYRSYLLANPMPSKGPPVRPVRHTICSLEQLKLLLHFFTASANDPQIAMMMALGLLYAFTREQLSVAKVSWVDDQMIISCKAKEKGFKTRAQRPQELVLPKEPRWFRDLQTRFYGDWLVRRRKMNATIDFSPLLIHDNCIDSQAVGRSWIGSRIKKGTLLATGVAIPLSVLRQTSAVIHKKGFDASVLTRLGWASRTTINYVWAPTIFFTPKK